MQPRDFLAIAKGLQAQAGGHKLEEGIRRTIVGRAYYAAFLHAREYLRRREGNPKLFTTAKNVHAAVIAVLRSQGASTDEMDASDALEGLRDRRFNADYELRTPKLNWGAEVIDGLAEADKVFSLLP